MPRRWLATNGAGVDGSSCNSPGVQRTSTRADGVIGS